ncbi:hypothetical protein SHKM778_49830 [Streptomyces sp. KM77-8]|uniref:HTH tetR-type domain-containing protein n=1 Tax=Streptomyces haneummycinicus TaxID=3074435 RepID=A0AAT9HME0_9ACTN
MTRATFYRHFPSKESLVVACLSEADRAIRGRADAAVAAGLPAADTVRALGAAIAEDIRSPGFRGAPSSTRSPSSPTPGTRCTWPSSRTASGCSTPSRGFSPRSGSSPPNAPPATS